jgi:branched-chain amino acid transport system permease protein
VIDLPLAITLQAFTDVDFWIGVLVLAGTYGIFALGLQLNVGQTGIVNFGQAGFMAVGAYTMGILVVESGWSFWVSLPVAIAAAMAFGVLVGLPSLRLRADYLAIATLAAAEIVRLAAQNLRDLTGGNQGLFGFDDQWSDVSKTIEGWFEALGINDVPSLLPLLSVVWVVLIVLTAVLSAARRTPWGRVLKAIREDEDAVRALGKSTLGYKLQSLAIAAALGAVAGFFLALNLSFLNPQEFQPLFTFLGYAVLILGGLGSYWGIPVGAVVLWTILEGTRFIDLPISTEKEAALRFVIVGVILIGLMAFRPIGLFGKREEMVLGD